jgi:hypothetical protein
MRPDKVRCAVKEATFTLDTTTMQVSASSSVVNVQAILERTRQMDKDSAVIAAIRHALSGGGMNVVRLAEQVAQATGHGFKAVRAVIDRWGSEDARDASALWILSFMRTHNSVHVSLRSGDRS